MELSASLAHLYRIELAVELGKKEYREPSRLCCVFKNGFDIRELWLLVKDPTPTACEPTIACEVTLEVTALGEQSLYVVPLLQQKILYAFGHAWIVRIIGREV